MPRKKTPAVSSIPSRFGHAPNVACLSEVRLYVFKDGSTVGLKTEITGPIGHQTVIEECIEEHQERFRVTTMEGDDVIGEIGELRKREAKYFFTAPLAPPELNEVNHKDGPELPF